MSLESIRGIDRNPPDNIASFVMRTYTGQTDMPAPFI